MVKLRHERIAEVLYNCLQEDKRYIKLQKQFESSLEKSAKRYIEYTQVRFFTTVGNIFCLGMFFVMQMALYLKGATLNEKMFAAVGIGIGLLMSIIGGSSLLRFKKWHLQEAEAEISAAYEKKRKYVESFLQRQLIVVNGKLI